MRVWLLQIGEPHPGDVAGGRLMRTGLFARELARRGHEVLWWSSAFDHIQKRLRPAGRVQVEPRYQIEFLPAPPYTRNIGLQRLKNHRVVAQAFARAAREADRPDVIVCSYPTIELSLEATRYGREQSVPVVVDIRDLWPDLFLDLVPRLLKPLGRAALAPMFREARQALRDATAITAVTQSFLQWGLRMAGRSAARDAVFPMGYPSWSAPHVPVGELAPGVDALLEQSFTACFFGTMGRQFDLLTVLDAARLLAGERVGFVLCGTGDFESALRRRARGLQNVVLPGYVSAADITAIMRRSAVGLAPYRVCENFNWNIPNKIYEYMSGGLPILSPLHGEVRALLESENAGLYYREGDARGLAAAILGLKHDAQRRACMARAASTAFQNKYTVELINNRMAEYLENLCGERARAPTMVCTS